MKTSDIVKKDSVAEFVHFRAGQLIYKVGTFHFSVPIEDVGQATFSRDEKAIMLMRWIRKEVEQRNSTGPGHLCCNLDTDGDGNCPVHRAPGVLRA